MAVPEIDVPPRGFHIWEWFFDATDLRRDHSELLTASDWIAWQQLKGAIIHAREWQVLREMDKAYVVEMRKERRDLQIRLAEKSENECRRR